MQRVAELARCAKVFLGLVPSEAAGAEKSRHPCPVPPPSPPVFQVGDRVFTTHGVGIIFAIIGPDPEFGDLGMPYTVGYPDGTVDTLEASEMLHAAA